MRLSKLFLVILCVVFIAGCINYEENVKLNADGSGTVVMHYSIAQQLFAMMQMGESTAEKGKEDEMPFKFSEAEIRSDMNAPGVTVEKVESKAEGDQQHFYVTAKFNKLTDLNQTGAFKKMKFEWNETDKNVTFRHVLEGDKKQKEEANPMGDQMASAMMGNAKFKFQVTLPNQALPAPDTNGTIQEDGKTVVWEWPLLEASKGQTMVASFEKGGFGGLPFSMPVLAAIGAGVVISVVALIIVIVMARKM
jgi:hypothetical protein